MPLAAGVFLAWVLAAILASQCLYADGANEFVRVLEKQGFVSFMRSRQFAFYVFQFPLVAALQLGVTDLAWLRWFFGLGCFLPWPLALLLCHRISREHFWLAAAACGAGYLNAAAMAVGEHILAHALFWPALFVLLFARPVKTGPALILLLMAIGLQFSYESQIFLSAPLLLLSLWRAAENQSREPGWARMVFALAAALFLTSIVNGLYAIWMPELPANLTGFKSGALGILQRPGWNLVCTALWCGLAAAACRSEKIWRGLNTRWGFCLIAAAVLVWGCQPLLAPDRVDTGILYDNRALNLLVPLALLPMALILRFRPDWLASRPNRLPQFAALLLLAQSLWHLSNTALWYRDVVWMQETLAAKRGIYPLRSTVLAADGMLGRELRPDAIGGRFDWSWPCLSLSLTPGKDINCLIVSEVFIAPEIRRRCWQPFDPFQPATLPRLEPYGLSYSNYLAGLRQQTQN